MDKASETISKATNLYSSVDKAYSTVINSTIGKTLAKKLGIEPPKEKFDLKKFVKNMDYESDAEVQAKAVRVRNMDTLKNALKELNADSGGTAGTDKTTGTGGTTGPSSPSGGSGSSSSPSPSGGSGSSSSPSPSGGSGSSSSPSLPSPSSASSSSSIFGFFGTSGSSGSSRTTRPAAASERVRATSDRLEKMATDSSEAVSKIKTGRDITTDLLRRNNDLLNGNK